MEALKKVSKKKVIIAIIIFVIIVIAFIYTKNYLKGVAAAALIKGEQKGTGENPTLSTQQLDALSDTIYKSLNQDWYSDWQAVITAFSSLNNDADFYGLVENFGTRSWGIVFKSNYTLPQAVHAFLTPETITQINSALAQRGITATI